MFDAAIKDFNDAIRINPTAAAHFVGRASAHMYKEEFREAIADFTEAIRLSPGDEYTFLHRGIAYHSVNEPDNAIADYSEAHRINPLDTAPLLNRGIVYYSKKGQYDLAIKDFTDCLKIDPKEVNCLINRGISWREKGDPDKAIVDFTEALRLGLLTGDVLQFGSKEPEAVRHWAQVAHARYQRGTAYVLKTEYDLALADFNESIRLNPDRGPRVRRAWRRLSRPPGVQARHRRLRRGHPARSRIRLRLFPARLRLSCDRGAGQGL